jgi:hypothetical protein
MKTRLWMTAWKVMLYLLVLNLSIVQFTSAHVQVKPGELITGPKSRTPSRPEPTTRSIME